MTRTMRVRSLLVLLLPALIMIGCRPAPTTTTGETVERLFSARQQFEGARSLANVKVTGRNPRSFRATIAIDASGRLDLAALTPFGTTAAQVRIDDDRVVLINHLRDIYWEGSLDQLSGGHALADAFRFEGLPYLLAGIPPWRDPASVRQEVVSDELTRLSSEGLSLIVGRSGIVSALLRMGSDTVNVQFQDPAIPPAKLAVASSVDPMRTVQFEHISLEFEPVSLQPLGIPEQYERADYWETVLR